MITKTRNRMVFRPIGTAALAVAALLVALAPGCGEWNDNPAGSFSAQVVYPGESAAALEGDFTSYAIVSPFDGSGTADPVLSMVIGAIVITHRSTPYTSADQVTPANQDLIEDDVLQSVKYFEVFDLPHPGNTLSFRIPPSNAGNWQLVAGGSRHNLDTLDDIKGSSFMWYGFSPEFLNGKVNPGDTVTIDMGPACSVSSRPDPAGDVTGFCL